MLRSRKYRKNDNDSENNNNDNVSEKKVIFLIQGKKKIKNIF